MREVFQKLMTVLLPVTLLLALLGGCAKELPEKESDDLKEESYLISEINSAEMLIETYDNESTNALLAEDPVVGSYALNEVTLRPVRVISGPKKLHDFFKDLEIESSAPKQRFAVTFELTESYLVAKMKLVGQQLPTHLAAIASEQFVPLFQYPIEQYGIKRRAKNDLEEETRNIEFVKRDKDSATHVKIPSLVKNREIAGLRGLAKNVKEAVHVKSVLDGKILSVADIRRLLKNQTVLQTSPANDEELNPQDLYQVRFFKNKLYLFRPVNHDDLTDVARDLLKQQGSETKITKCSPQVAKRVNIAVEKCALRVEFALTVKPVNLKLNTDKDKTLGSVTLDHNIDPSSAKLVHLNVNQKIEEIKLENSKDLGVQLVGFTALPVAQFKDKEFHYRRVLADSPNLFNYTFAGSAGKLDIVRFEFEDGVVIVKRANALLQKTGTTEVDDEVLLKFNAFYLKKRTHDSSGRKLEVPEYKRASHEEAGAVAYIELENNLVPNPDSALSFYSLKNCFSSTAGKKALDAEIREGDDKSLMLNFTMMTTYIGSPNPNWDCAGVFSAGWTDKVQTNFTFKERVSFKEYVNKGSEEPALNMPFSVQKKLGFGLFTGKKVVPKGFSEKTDVEDAEVHLPSVYDIKDGKQITYVIAGIPVPSDLTGLPDKMNNDAKLKEHLELRMMLIEATKEVIADINEGFRKALKGTGQERSKDVVLLKIEQDEMIPAGAKAYEGLEVVPRRSLGDLDRNYVYYMAKGTKYPILGLGGAHANPRSGEVVSASVYLYGGNMKRSVEHFRKLQKAEKELAKNLQPKSQPAMDMLPAAQGITELPKISDASMKQLTTFKRAHKHLPHDAIMAQERLAEYEIDLVSKTSSAQMKEHSIKMNHKHQKFYDLVEKAVNKNIRGHELEAMFAGKEQSEVKSRAEIFRKLHDKGICVYTKENALASVIGKGYDVSKKTDNEVLIDIWRPTLAHEIGHNLGLRHNFIASYDKKNWKFDKEDKSERTYSSVMDYLQDDHATYDGLGPYDVYALRAAYTRLVELAQPAAQTEVKVKKEVDGKLVDHTVKIHSGKFVDIEDYKTLIGLDSWLNISDQAMAKLPLKDIKFCSDGGAGQSPFCMRFDHGATAVDIVDNIIKNYRIRYALSNFPGDKKTFTGWSTGGYVGRLFGDFLTIRQFNEELFYQAIYEGADQAVVSDIVQAVQNGYFFLMSIIRNPDVLSYVAPTTNNRFMPATVTVMRRDENGQTQRVQVPKVIETKALKDIYFDGESDRLQLRGVEFDKVVALIALTTERMGIPRYFKRSLRIPYHLVEKYVFGLEPKDSILTGLLKEILSDNVQPAAYLPNEPISKWASLPAPFKVELSELLRNYAVIGSIVNLDVRSFEPGDNPSRSFRVLNSRRPVEEQQKGFKYVSKVAGDIKYFATAEDAVASKELISVGDYIRRIKESGITQLLTLWRSLVESNVKPEVIAAADVFSADELELMRVKKFNATAADEYLSAIESIIAQLKAQLKTDLSAEDKKAAQIALLTEEAELEKFLGGQITAIREKIEELQQSGGDISSLVAVLERIQPKYYPLLEAKINAMLYALPNVSTNERLNLASINNVIGQVIQMAKNLSQAPNQQEAVARLKVILSNYAKNYPIVGLAISLVNAETVGAPLLKDVSPAGVLDSQDYTIKSNIEMLSQFFLMLNPEYNK